jgi:glycerol-3-phosphate acyltransferase PlsY
VSLESTVWPFVVGYAIGSIPFAWIVVRRATGLDLRRVGSRNIGAANALRTTRWRTGLLVALLDLAKGSAAVGLVGLGGGSVAACSTAGFAAVAGHVFPLWLRFHGGKGVATACGAFAVLTPPATLAAGVVFVVTALATRLVSLASLAATAVLALASAVLVVPRPVERAAIGAALLVAWCHRSNVVRLVRGTERRVGRAEGPS